MATRKRSAGRGRERAPLGEYRAKRDFAKTREPAGGAVEAPSAGRRVRQLRFVIQGQGLNVFIFDVDLILLFQIGCQGGQSERREERIFNRPPIGAGRFSECGQDQLDPESCHRCLRRKHRRR